jgi:hypothetical protein
MTNCCSQQIFSKDDHGILECTVQQFHEQSDISLGDSFFPGAAVKETDLSDQLQSYCGIQTRC